MKVSIELESLSTKALMRVAMEITDPEALDKIAESSRSELVLAAVAGNECAWVSTVRKLAQNKNVRVKNAALKNLESCP